MTSAPKLGRLAEKALYYGSLSLIALCGVAVAVSAATGRLRLALLFLGAVAVLAALVAPVHAARSRRFVGVVIRQARGEGVRTASSGPAGAAATRSGEMGPEAVAMLARLNRQITALAEDRLVAQASSAVPVHADTNLERVEAAIERGRADTLREIEVLRAELAYLAIRVEGRDVADRP